MAVTTKSFPITVPIVSISEPELLVSEVQNVAGALLFDESVPSYTDYTTEANSDVAGDVPLMPDPQSNNDAFLIGAAVPWDWCCFKIGTAGAGFSIDVKYWNGSIWDDLNESLALGSTILYDRVEHFRNVGYCRLLLNGQPGDWTTIILDGKSLYWMMFVAGAGMTVQPIADRIWLGTWSVAYSESWSDSLALSDSAALVFDFHKNMSENMAISDAGGFQWDSALSFSDIMAISDSAPDGGFSWTIPRNWSEIMAISDGAPGGGSFAWELMKNVTDTLSMTDTLLKSLPKVWADNIIMTDSFAKQMGKSFADLMTIIGVLHIGNFVLFSDQVTISDALVKQVGKIFTDTVTISSVLIYQVGKNMSENMSLADVFVLGTGIAWQDQIAIADDLYKSLFIAEPEPQMVDTLVSPHLQTLPWMPYIAIGTSNLTEADVVGNITTLMNEVYRKQGTVRVVANTYFVRAEFGQDEPTADDLTIYEVGIFDQATDGNMAHRWVLDTGSAKDNIDEIVVECAITILHGEMLTHLLSFTGEAGAEMLASILSGGGSSVAKAKDSQSISDTLTWKLN